MREPVGGGSPTLTRAGTAALFFLFALSALFVANPFTVSSPGSLFRAALVTEKPLQIAGSINAYAALLAQRAGFRALYLSGAGVANHSYGIPDTGETTLED